MPDTGAHHDTVERDEINRLRAEISRRRERLGSSLLTLEHRVQEGVDWRHWVRAHPLTAVGLAALAGYLVARPWSRRTGDAG